MDKLFCLLGLIAVSFALTDGATFCYYGSWAAYGQNFHTTDIDPHLCTHLLYAFAGLNGTSYEVQILDPYVDLCEDDGLCGYQNFTALKEENPELKTLLSIGGWSEGSKNYSIMANNPEYRAAFVESSVSLIKEFGFDGIDLDWEYPTQRGGIPADKENFVTLLEEFKQKLAEDGLLLTIAVAAGKPTIEKAYDIPGIVDAVDYVNLMSYDFHGSWEPYTHANAPLFAYPEDEAHGVEFLNVDFSVQYWIAGGCPPEKLVLGIPAYGQTWKLEDANQTGFYAPAKGKQVWSYSKICLSQITSPNWVIVHDESMNEPYAYDLSQNNLWVSYDDPESVKMKAAYAREQGLGGCMVWSLNLDDYTGVCGRPYDLVKSITEEFTN